MAIPVPRDSIPGGESDGATTGAPGATVATRIASVIGWSGSGKTTLIARAIAECARRGVRCSAAKRARHAPDIAPDGKDSTLFLESGALASAYIGDTSTALFSSTPAELDREYYIGLLPPSDLILLEGATVEGALRVLVAGATETETGLKRPLSEIDLLVAFSDTLRATATSRGVPAIHPDSVDAFVDFIMKERTMEMKEEKEVQVLCDGKPLPLVPFVASLFANTIVAMVGSLKGGETAKEITIVVRSPK